MTISRNVVEGAGSEVVEKDTKTHAARRIALDPDTVTMMETQRESRQVREGLLNVGPERRIALQPHETFVRLV